MEQLDLTPAARALADLVGQVGQDDLDRPTPCPEYRLGDLVEHVGGLAMAFTAAARKEVGPGAATSQPPAGDRSRLEPGWRHRIVGDLAGLGEAWRDPSAWTGMTAAGGVDLPGEVAGLVALDELVLHGWDVARSLGQAYQADAASLEAVHRFVAGFSGPGHDDERAGLFGPEVAVPEAAPLLDRVVGMAGRQPGWRPPG